jgi:hypothetical protein
MIRIGRDEDPKLSFSDGTTPIDLEQREIGAFCSAEAIANGKMVRYVVVENPFHQPE